MNLLTNPFFPKGEMHMQNQFSVKMVTLFKKRKQILARSDSSKKRFYNTGDEYEVCMYSVDSDDSLRACVCVFILVPLLQIDH